MVISIFLSASISTFNSIPLFGKRTMVSHRKPADIAQGQIEVETVKALRQTKLW